MVFNLSQFGTNIAVVTEQGQKLSYKELLSLVDQIGAGLRKNTLSFCLCHNSIGSLVGYLAFLEFGIPTVMLDGDKSKDLIDSLINVYHPHYIWLPTERKQDLSGNVIEEIEGYSMIECNFPSYDIEPSVALLLTTSGSTGSPKLVRLTTKNLLSNAESIAEFLQIDEDERPITSLPMYYSYGLSVINSHLLKGATLLLTDRTVIQKEFWSFAKEAEATSISGVPYTYEMLRRLRIFRMDLPKLKTMTQAGGKLNAGIVEEYIKNANAVGKRFIVMYGQTEATARMSYLPEKWAIEKYSSIGIAIPGGKFSLIDADGRVITEPNVDGELIYEGANVSMGYAESINDLAKDDENHGILHTGDIARMDADGFYYITGRLKRFVKVWGNRCNLDATEQLLKGITTNCACVGVDDKITIFVTTEGLDGDIKTLLAEKMGLNTRAFEVRIISEIPKNSSGKVQYAELQKML